MSTLTVSVEQDHLEKLVRSPLAGLAELVWNALDADAKKVTLSTTENDAGGIDTVQIVDDGAGISPEAANMYFGHLGGSWKKTTTATDGGRALHGQNGQGRWSAYGLGEFVRWESVAERVVGGSWKTTIGGRRSALREFVVSDPVQVDDTPTGTTVTIENLTDKAARELAKPQMLLDLTTTFALYLQQYGVEVWWQKQRLDPSLLQIAQESVSLEVEGVDDPIELVIIEWDTSVDRALHLCDENGLTLTHIAPGIHAPGFEFTAYLKWKGFRDNQNQILLGEMAEEPLPAVMEAAKDALRKYFKERQSERGRELVETWKADNTYPYEGEPADKVEEAERDMFEIVAVAAAPVVENTDKKSRALSLRLMREALETSPGTLHMVLREVLDLPSDRQEELRILLERTTLSNLISSAREITDRLDFLAGLEQIVFDKELKKHVKERSQLHRILAGETWVFREEYALTADDHTLATALKAHIGLLGREGLAPADLDAEVLDGHGRRVVVDLMLSRVIMQERNHREHLVIEIKRPSVHIGLEQFAQIQNYATTVAEDARFAQTDVRWEFWIVGDTIDKAVRRLAEQNNREPGVVVDSGNFVVRAVTWATIIQDARHKLKFVRDSLDYASTQGHGMDYLRRTHGKYLPEAALADEEATPSTDGDDSESAKSGTDAQTTEGEELEPTATLESSQSVGAPESPEPKVDTSG